jgi:hypothetical protein
MVGYSRGFSIKGARHIRYNQDYMILYGLKCKNDLLLHLVRCEQKRAHRHRAPGRWGLRASDGLENQLSGAGDRRGLEEILGVLTMGRYGWWRLKPKEEGGTVMAALHFEQYSKERKGKRIRWERPRNCRLSGKMERKRRYERDGVLSFGQK